MIRTRPATRNPFTQPVNRVEAKSNFTLGHASSEGGLRAHSMGDLFPFRVVGVGEAWEVHVHDKRLVERGLPLEDAHAYASKLKEFYGSRLSSEDCKFGALSMILEPIQ